MKKVIFLFALSAIFSAFKTSEVLKTYEVSRSALRPGKDFAVFFAVEKYQNGKLTNLQNPIKNARDLAEALKNRFGFETEILENPTQDRIIGKLNELARLYARNEDGKHPSDGQLFLFFSGHGLSEDENGYFLPADADPSKPWDKGIAYEIWRPKIDKINCRHILVAIDACYSVRFDPDWKNKTDGQFKRPGEMTDSQRALANYENYKARVFFTSDNKEDQTPDRSNFVRKLIEGFRDASASDGFLTSKQIFANFVEGATPTPRAGTFGDDEPSSAFLFYEFKGMIKSVDMSVKKQLQKPRHTLYDGYLGDTFDLGFDDGKQRRNWLAAEGNRIKMSYPGNLGWGAVYITDKPKTSSSKCLDLTGYDSVYIELRSERSGDIVRIGIKDCQNRETKIQQPLQTEWQIYAFSLNQFKDCDLKAIFMPLVLTFDNQPTTIYCKSIYFE